MNNNSADMRAFITISTLLLFLFSLSTNIMAIQTYVDHEITISENGASNIIGSSNVIVSNIVPANDTLLFETNFLTSKKGDYWTFTYQTDTNVSVSLVKVHLPAHVVVNYVKSSASTFIESGDSVLLTFTSNNQPINITIQYSFKNTQSLVSGSTNNNTLSSYFSNTNRQSALIVLGCALFIIIFGAVVVAIKHKRKNPSVAKIKSAVSGIDIKKLNTLKLTLNETQIKIIDALLTREGKATQNAIAHHTQIPKASLSRNVDLLVQKQILVKHSGGYTNQLVFHESLQLSKSI